MEWLVSVFIYFVKQCGSLWLCAKWLFEGEPITWVCWFCVTSLAAVIWLWLSIESSSLTMQLHTLIKDFRIIILICRIEIKTQNVKFNGKTKCTPIPLKSVCQTSIFACWRDAYCFGAPFRHICKFDIPNKRIGFLRCHSIVEMLVKQLAI